MTKRDSVTVFICLRNSCCGECGRDLGNRAWITLNRDRGAFCLSYSDLAHLVFLPAGNVALARRSQKHSRLSAIVLRWSRTRKRYERQRLLVEERALERAETECLADEEARERRRRREAELRSDLDQQYMKGFAARIREIYPKCPGRLANSIVADHACRK